MSDMYELTEITLKNQGFVQYEVSNYAKNLDHRSTHNWNYWTGGSYIGIGPGAHSRVQKGGSGQREARIQTLEPGESTNFIVTDLILKIINFRSLDV